MNWGRAVFHESRIIECSSVKGEVRLFAHRFGGWHIFPFFLAVGILTQINRPISKMQKRASMVSHRRDYPWSSYRANGDLRASTLVTPHDGYIALGETPCGIFPCRIPPFALGNLRRYTKC